MGGYLTLSKTLPDTRVIEEDKSASPFGPEPDKPKPAEALVRSFYPISPVDQEGFFVVLFKKLTNPVTGAYLGKFSELIDQCALGEHFELIGHDYRYRYNGFGDFDFKDIKGATWAHNKVRSLIMIAQNTNISTFFQFIDTVSSFNKDDIHMTLLYTVDDLVYL